MPPGMSNSSAMTTGISGGHDAVDELEHVVGLVHPHADEALVAVALGVADDLAL